MAEKSAVRLVANNKKAYHDYFIEEKYECGIELFGTEVKSIRMGKVSIKEAYVAVSGGEAWIEGMNISPYEKGNIFNREPAPAGPGPDQGLYDHAAPGLF